MNIVVNKIQSENKFIATVKLIDPIEFLESLAE